MGWPPTSLSHRQHVLAGNLTSASVRLWTAIRQRRIHTPHVACRTHCSGGRSMAELITAVETADVRFPTSLDLDGSDAMNPEPDYSGAYVTIRTSEGATGYGLAFTVGRGNEVEVAAVHALARLVIGLPVDELLGDLGAFSRRLTGDSQLRWLGPEKGAIHMAAAAIINAVWDLAARAAGKPLWRLLADLTP